MEYVSILFGIVRIVLYYLTFIFFNLVQSITEYRRKITNIFRLAFHFMVGILLLYSHLPCAAIVSRVLDQGINMLPYNIFTRIYLSLPYVRKILNTSIMSKLSGAKIVRCRYLWFSNADSVVLLILIRLHRKNNLIKYTYSGRSIF